LALFRDYTTPRLTGFAGAIERKSGCPDAQGSCAVYGGYTV
jgi:hypothetical protein